MEGFDPVGRAGGVAYLRVTPFAAERALAVPRQPPTIGLTPTSPSPAPSRMRTGRAWPPMHDEVT